jgi:hypothetical protein
MTSIPSKPALPLECVNLELKWSRPSIVFNPLFRKEFHPFVLDVFYKNPP